MDIEVTTTLTRQILDNLYQANNPGHAVYEQAIGETTLDDLMTTEVGRSCVRSPNRRVLPAYDGAFYGWPIVPNA